MEELIIDTEYSIVLKEVVISKMKLPYEEVKKFNKLGVKGKVSRLKYLKYLRGKEIELISIIAQSKYLKLLKDNCGFHLRVEEDLDESDYLLELKVANYLMETYPILLDEEFNTGMSGDRNRIEISRGNLLD